MDVEIDIAQIILSFFLVIGLIGLCAFMLKWFSEKSLLMRQMGGQKRLKLSETMMLDSKHKVFLFECDDQEFMAVTNGTQFDIRLAKKSSDNESQDA